jgi:predicted RND superfamily exporter protein
MLKGKIKDRSTKTVWVEFRDGFQVEIRYTPLGLAQSLVENSIVTRLDTKTMVETTERDNEKFYLALATEALVGWRGLTPEVLRKMVEMEEDDYPAEEVPYSIEDAVELLAKAYDFNKWVQRIAATLECFQIERRAAETKNS